MKTVPPEAYSDDIAAVSRAVGDADAEHIAIKYAMYAAEDTGDIAVYESAVEALDAAYDRLVMLEGRLLDLENRDARAEERSLRAWHQWATR